MAPSLSLRGLLMVVICSLAVFSLVQTLDTLYVKPTPDTPCDKDPCLTLMEYADNSSQYFTRDTEAVFLSGQHLLGRNISIINVTIFIMRKEINAFQSHPEIVCAAQAGLSFINVSSLAISELSFVSCSVQARNSNVSIENIQFYNSSESGAIDLYDCETFFNGVNVFADNKAEIGGGVFVEGGTVSFEGSNSFMNNSASTGGAIAIQESEINFNGTQSFEHNVASQGGAMLVSNSMLSIKGNSSFIKNSGGYGGAIASQDSEINFNGTQSFEDNVVSEIGGAIAIARSTVNMKGYSSFINNSAGRQGGAMMATNGQLNITGNVSFIGNHARFGGGLDFEYFSQLLLESPLELSFQHNRASQKGGAIYVNDETNGLRCFDYRDPIFYLVPRGCFIRIDSLSNETDIQLGFNNNTAGEGGGNIFGGMLDKCLVNDKSSELGLSLLDGFNTSTISSEPLRLCFCMNGKENCEHDPPPFSTVRGETISVSAVAFDQVNHTVAATIRSYFPYNNETVSDFGLGQGVQQIGATCTPLNYTVLTTASNVTFILYAEGPCRDIGNSQRQISVRLLPCPIAFELSNTQCICEVRMQPLTNSCSTESETFRRNTNFWVGTEYRDGNYTGLILNPRCSLDYCTSNPADISVNDLDSQCSFNRSGILCGACQQNLSLALGSSQCLQCSNYYLALLFPFAVAGVALVFILFILQLTVSKGTLNGLIFYANIVAVNRELLFPLRTTSNLFVFLAWLNLDLGTETCFFNGMDTYARTWLQYAFPFYIWLLVCIIIVTSHYSARASKLLGKNPIAVLATLFLLSYAKLLRTIIATFSAAVLDYPGNSTDTVWLYDGNIRYLRGKHIPLFLFSLAILLFLFLPYTVLLFLSQWLHTLSNKKYFFWMNSLRVKTFLDAYHAPYNITHRYWTGLLLLLRCVLCLVFASNASGDPSVNLLAISSVALGLAMSTRVIGQVYSKWWLDILEGSFILNLGITAVATFYVMQSGGDQSAVAYISVSVAFAEFVGILTYHAYQQLKDTNVWKSAQKRAQRLLMCIRCRNTDEPPTPLEEEVISMPSTTTIELHELRSYELREPLLDLPS